MGPRSYRSVFGVKAVGLRGASTLVYVLHAAGTRTLNGVYSYARIGLRYVRTDISHLNGEHCPYFPDAYLPDYLHSILTESVSYCPHSCPTAQQFAHPQKLPKNLHQNGQHWHRAHYRRERSGVVPRRRHPFGQITQSPRFNVRRQRASRTR